MSIFLPLVALGCIALLCRTIGRTWLEPGAFVALLWFGVVCVSLLVRKIFPVNALGLWVIVSLVACYSAGTLCFSAQKIEAPKAGFAPWQREIDGFVLGRIFVAVLVFSSLGFVGLILEAKSGLSRSGLGLTGAAMLSLGHFNSEARYAGTASTLGITELLGYIIYAAAPLAGMLAAGAEKRWQRMAAGLPLLLSLLQGTLNAARAGILLTVTMGVAGFLGWKIRSTGGRYRVFGGVGIALGVGGAFALFSVYVGLQVLRGGSFAPAPIQPLIDTALASLFSSVSAFGEWLSVAGPRDPALGSFTLAGPFDLLGLSTRVQGLYADPVIFSTGGSSNIYTALRALIDDFTLPGAWVLLLVLGAGSSLSFRACMRGRVGAVVPLALCYAFWLFSPMNSMLIFSSIVGGWLLALLTLVWAGHRDRRIRSAASRVIG